VRQVPLAPKQLAAEFLLERVDRTAQGGHADAALLGGASEIQCVGRPEKIANLMHFHDIRLAIARSPSHRMRISGQRRKDPDAAPSPNLISAGAADLDP
jgi:hypothetical protein